jgi:leucyl/phenylalanyl-tRNA--protein transferase
MAIYELIENIAFPDIEEAEPDGLLAIGGDLSPERVLYALTLGIFPWFNEGDPILWWSPDPRFVVFPEKVKISKSLKQSCKKFSYNINQNFNKVIENCSTINRKGQQGTWITESMKDCYLKLHEFGYAMSFESYFNNELVGGLYGVNLGGVFIGESMFHKVPDAGKAAFILLTDYCMQNKIYLIDCQLETILLKSLGGENIPRKDYSKYLSNFVKSPFQQL